MEWGENEQKEEILFDSLIENFITQYVHDKKEN